MPVFTCRLVSDSALPRLRHRLALSPLPLLLRAAGVGILMGTVTGAAQANALSCTPEPQPMARRTAAAPEPEDPNSPVELQAQSLRSQLAQETLASGAVELHRAGLVLTADSLRYLHEQDRVIAQGRVHITQGGNQFDSEQASYVLNTQRGELQAPRFRLSRAQAGGQARDLAFDGTRSLSANDVAYSSCDRPAGEEPDWVLRMDHLSLDFEHNEGRAEGAVLRFLGTPILALPVLSFPATEAPKSGWLPPSLSIDTTAGAAISVPYYWRIAPNLDATLAPEISTKRGSGLRGDFRYLWEHNAGRLEYHLLPNDRVQERERYSTLVEHEGNLPALGLRYGLHSEHASDDAYWKDFSDYLPSLTPRLLPRQAWTQGAWQVDRFVALESYARVQTWQVLQDSSAWITPPYQRQPQVGMRAQVQGPWGLRYNAEAEANHFTLGTLLPTGVLNTPTLPQEGRRLHLTQSVSRPWDNGWAWFTPQLSLNQASYRYHYVKQAESDLITRDDGVPLGRPIHLTRQRNVPTFSMDAGLRFERDATPFGQSMVQTLEPRIHYVYTPYRHQDDLPLFDTAVSDFNAVSIYADNAFTGIDRISDANQVTFGATSRLLDRQNGVEVLRFGAAQRYLFRPQRLTATGSNGNSSSNFSDMLLYASGRFHPHWYADSALQYDFDFKRPVRTLASIRYQPAPFHTLAATYRYTRQLTEQTELAWQWPIYRGDPGAGSGGCQRVLYGVGRVSYNMRDSRLADSLAGIEYDAGCWIMRAVAQRVTTGSTGATTRVMLQLELVGLSRLGTNPLQTLKDNIPGYRLLRDNDSP